MSENSDFFPQVMLRYKIHSLQPDVDQDFIAALLHSFEEKAFCAKDFEPFPIEMIVDYILRTHVYYLQKKLPEIEQSIILLSGHYHSQHPVLTALQNFFHRYCQDLTHHIHEEETKLLPYIASMCRATHAPEHFSRYTLSHLRYSVSLFLDDHHDTEDELRDIRHTIGLYEPPATNESLCRILIAQLQTFEHDLQVHAHIEEKVLIPKALKMEADLKEQLLQTAKWN
ncbi:MAG TPA: hemerythrin domain-containing protein [Puia sp.]|nr:hemerythrin domain-containing protein [Puia sp.]